MFIIPKIMQSYALFSCLFVICAFFLLNLQIIIEKEAPKVYFDNY